MRIRDFKPGQRVCFAKLSNGYVLSDGILLNKIKITKRRTSSIKYAVITYVMGTDGLVFAYPLSELNYIDSKNNVEGKYNEN